MRIIHLNGDDFGGGAYRSALRLHTGLLSRGMDSRMLVGMKRSAGDRVQALVFSDRPTARGARALRRVRLAVERACSRRRHPVGYEAFDDDRSQYGPSLVQSIPTCDVLNLHFVAGLLDFSSCMPLLGERAAVVWTLHDMNPFTGGCHFDDQCGRWMQGCGRCPQLGSRRANDLSARTWKRKILAMETIEPTRMCIVAPSSWMARQAARSPMLGRFRVETIPYSVDTNVYKPRDRRMCREILGLDPDAPVVLFIAQQVRNRRKGYALLVDALRKLSNLPRLQLVTVGIDVPALKVPVPVRHLGKVGMEGLLTVIYNAADVFAAPSLQDNLPNTVLESLACGTPVVGFDVGGIADMVRDGETGYLAAAQDVDELAAAIERVVTDELAAQRMRHCSREVAEREYGASLQAECYVALYRRMVG